MVENGTFTAEKKKNNRDLLMIKYIRLHTGGKMFTLISEVPAIGIVTG